MFSCIPPNDRPVKKPRFNELPECPVSSSSIACVGCRRVGLIESFVPTGMMSPEFPAGFLRPGEREQVLEFVTEMRAIYHNFELELRLYLSKRREYDERHADNVWTHARKQAKNDSLLLETIQKMMILESEPRDWVRMDFNSYYMMPECFYRLARERGGRRRAGDR